VKPLLHRAAGSDERLLLRKVATKDAPSLALLYQRFGGLVFTVALRLTNDREVAEEVTQDVFLRCWQRADSYDETRGGVQAWLMGMARNRAIDVLRGAQHHARSRETPLEAAPLCGFDPYDTALSRLNLETALATLSSAQREAIVLSFFGGLTQNEVATLLNLPLGTVKSRIRDGMGRLRGVLGHSPAAVPGSAV
jgi:RNA polymerase sigma-70 factor (ECF subfamily)